MRLGPSLLAILAALSVRASLAEGPADVRDDVVPVTATVPDAPAEPVTEAAAFKSLTDLMDDIEDSGTTKRAGVSAALDDRPQPSAQHDVPVAGVASDGVLDKVLDRKDGRAMLAAVAALNGTKLSLPLPMLDGEAQEDFMVDMQEIESDMEMVERSAAKDIDAETTDLPVDESQTELPLPVNHKARGFNSNRNSLSKEMNNKYEMMMARLPVKDYNITGRDKPLNVVFVFPRVVNETRKRELEVMLVFPHDKNVTETTAGPQNTTTAHTPIKDDDEMEASASEQREVTASPPATTPSTVSAVVRSRKEPEAHRRDIYKKAASKYAHSRPPPVSFFRRDNVRREQVTQTPSSPGDDRMDVAESELHPVAVSWMPGYAGRPLAPPSTLHIAVPPAPSEAVAAYPPRRAFRVRPTVQVANEARIDYQRRRQPTHRWGLTTSTTTSPSPTSEGALAASEVESTTATSTTSSPRQQPPLDPGFPPSSAAPAQPVDLARINIRKRPLRLRPVANSPADVGSDTAPRPTPTSRWIRPRIIPTQGRLQARLQAQIHRAAATPPAAAGPANDSTPTPNLPVDKEAPRTTPSDATTSPTPSAAAAPLLSGDDATVRQITELQSQKSENSQDRLERLTALQSMLVAQLMTIQKELAERYATLRRQMGHGREVTDDAMPAEHRAHSRALQDNNAETHLKRYRRPPAFRKPLPVERKDAIRYQKLSIRTLYKKVLPSPKQTVDSNEASSTSSTPTTPSSRTESAPITTTDAPLTTLTPATATSSTTGAFVMSSVTEAATATTTGRPQGLTGIEMTTMEPTTDAATDRVPDEVVTASGARPNERPAEEEVSITSTSLDSTTPGSVADARVGAVAAPVPPFQPLQPFQTFELPAGDRLASLAGLLSEDDPGLATLARRERGDRSAFRPPAVLESGFVPMVPMVPSGAPQIVGPIPRGYRDVLRGVPVQLDLPQPGRHADFLRRPAQG